MSNPSAPGFVELVHRLRANRFRDLSGGHVTATIPVSADLINELIATTLPADAPVRGVMLRPEAGDRFSVRIQPKAAFFPAFSLDLAIVNQPRLPESAVLTLRMVTLGGLFGLASGAIAGMLPPGVRLEGERIHVDLRGLAQQRGAGEAFDYLKSLEIHSEPGRVVVLVEAMVDGR